MKKLTTLLLAAAASLGLAFASTGVMAQKAETPKKVEAPKTAPAAKKADAKKIEAPKAEPAKPSSEPMDINSASESELATLKGIGDVRAKAIVKGRPYKGKDDLLKKKIVPKNVYEDIKGQIIAKQDTAMKAPQKKAEPAKKVEPAKKANEKKK